MTDEEGGEGAGLTTRGWKHKRQQSIVGKGRKSNSLVNETDYKNGDISGKRRRQRQKVISHFLLSLDISLMT